MKLTDEQIKSIMEKDVSCKTILIGKNDEENVIKKHAAEGWEFVSKSELNGRLKITFRKIR